MNMKNYTGFDTVVFAGGGSRCFWQLGFWNVVSPELNLRPSVVAGTSTGSAFACFALASDPRNIVDYFKKIAGANKRNIYLKNIFRKAPVFPHYEMYKKCLLYALDDLTMKKLYSGPEIRILLARPPAWMGPKLAAIIGGIVYILEKKLFYPLHPVIPTKIGYRGEVVLIQDCGTKEELADLIMHSSCAPPLLPVMKRDNRVVLDGGMIDNVPVRIVEDRPGNKLVLLTRRYRDDIFPVGNGIKYIQPSEDITIPKWEYSDPEGVQYVYDLGRKDGEAFVKEYKQHD